MLSLKESIVDVVLKSLKWFVVAYLLLSHTGCTTAPNGAINRTTEKPTYEGYKIYDRYIETFHVYSQPVIINHGNKLTLFCKKHKKWEIIKAFWDSNIDNYYYIISDHKRW